MTMAMLPLRQRIERAIVGRCVRDALRAGYSVSVNDGEGFPIRRSRNATLIMRALFSTDEERLYIHASDTGRRVGWVFLVYGNDGPDVIADYTCNLESMLAGAEACAEALEARHASALYGR
jgi:hypothetical protein